MSQETGGRSRNDPQHQIFIFDLGNLNRGSIVSLVSFPLITIRRVFTFLHSQDQHIVTLHEKLQIWIWHNIIIDLIFDIQSNFCGIITTRPRAIIFDFPP